MEARGGGDGGAMEVEVVLVVWTMVNGGDGWWCNQVQSLFFKICLAILKHDDG
ncbi:Hypothetical predicted protein [Olea europaea subsp. europaea]|uniref:Uncharacterized protein n=1 Tax=Olea europaea subsp. europaea TaxID=158383 RepID=A0A8S0PCG8_OLEEU|nr:Hypothetical predicted protein [Olea europaea subsp. europaea]